MKKLFASILFCAALYAPCADSQQDAKPVYKDSNAPIADRIHDLLSKMTVEEKVAQLESGWVLPAFGSFKVPSPFEGDHLNEAMVKKLAANGLGTFAFLDEFLGSRESSDPRIGAKNRNLLQAWVLKNTRLGIPIMYHGEALHGAVTMSATAFPAAVGLGSTWDPELLQKMFTTVGLEARASGNALVLAPVLDLSRDPRYGRVEEMYSEDPYLVAQLGTAAVEGLQGMQSLDDRLDDNHVYSTLKHFVQGQPENGTNVGPNDFSERTMRGVFLYPFEQVVKNAHVEAVMPSYNENNGGIPSHANTWLLQDILRKEWNFTGLTVSDYTAVEQLAGLQHVAANASAAGVLAFKSGLDMELPTPAGFPGLVDAVKSGKISENDLDAAVSRVLSAKFRSGHLPVTIARNVGQLPVYYYKTPAARRGYVFDENSPLFPFDFGLSYTTFTFGAPTIDHDQISPSGIAKVSVTVTNSGSRAGDEVVQLYVHHVVSSVVQPVIALKGFKRIHLEPKASTTVTFDIGADQLSILNVGMNRVVEPGAVDLRLGPSSAETSSVRLTVVE